MTPSEYDQANLVDEQPRQAIPGLVDDIDAEGAGDFLAAHHVPIISPDIGIELIKVVKRLAFAFSDTGEKVGIVAKTSPTSWVITATKQSHAAGSALTASCSYTPLYWKFLADAHGRDTTNTNFVADSHWPVGGHDDWITGL